MPGCSKSFFYVIVRKHVCSNCRMRFCHMHKDAMLCHKHGMHAIGKRCLCPACANLVREREEQSGAAPAPKKPTRKLPFARSGGKGGR